MSPETSPIRVLFHDIDGCLNPEDGSQFVSGEEHRRLTVEQKSMLARVNAAIDDSSVEKVILATGRRLLDTLFIAEELATSKLRYVLSETGAVAYDLIQDATIDLLAVAEESRRPELAAPFEDLSEVQELIHWYNSGGEELLAEKIGSEIHQIPKETLLTLHVPPSATGSSLVEDLKQILRMQTSIQQGRLRFLLQRISRGYQPHQSTREAGPKSCWRCSASLLPTPLWWETVSTTSLLFEVCGHGFCPGKRGGTLEDGLPREGRGSARRNLRRRKHRGVPAVSITVTH